MLSFQQLIPFFVTSFLLAFTPGPGMLYIAAQTIGRGRRAGWFSVLGTHLGSYVHILAAAFGLTLLLAVIPIVYTIVKIIGAVYLFWLGYKFITSSNTLSISQTELSKKSHNLPLRESVLVEILNPKSAFFFIAFLPQFTDASGSLPVWAQILILGTNVNLIFSVAEAACVLFSEKVTVLIRTSEAATRWLRRTGGSILIALGVNLALSRQ